MKKRPLNFMAAISAVNAGLMKLLTLITAAVLLALTLDVLWGVITRYVFGHQAGYTDELATLLLIWLSFFGGALAFGKNAHIGLTVLTDAFDPATRRLCEAAAMLFSLAFVSLVWIGGGLMLLQTSMASGNRLATLPLEWWQIYVCVPLSGAFAAMFLLEMGVKKLIPEGEA